MFDELVKKLYEKGLTIGSVESLTAGLFCAKVAEISGASKVLKGGLVTYDPQLKISLANVNEKTIEDFGVVSQEVATQMARGGQKNMHTNICVSFTGNAGPTVLEGKKVGEVYIGIAFNEELKVFHKIFSGQRNEIREKVVCFACEKILQMLV